MQDGGNVGVYRETRENDVDIPGKHVLDDLVHVTAARISNTMWDDLKETLAYKEMSRCCLLFDIVVVAGLTNGRMTKKRY